MVMEFISGQMEASLKAIGKKTKSQATVSTTGKTEECTKDTGNKIICTDKVYTNGLTVGNMKVNTLMIRKRDTEFTNTRMVAVIKDSGNMESNMAKVLLSVLKEYLGKENGNKESDSIGLTKLILTMDKAIETQVLEGAV